MAKITYGNKENLVSRDDISNMNKITADDFNEIKDVVNMNFDLLEEGRILDTGTANTGKYIRFNNGIAICWYVHPTGVMAFTNHTANTFFYEESTGKGAYTWTFPIVFSSNPTVCAQFQSNGYTCCSLGGINSTSAMVYVCAPYNFTSRESAAYNLIAIGYWK